MIKKFVWDVERFADLRIAAIIRSEINKHTDPVRIGRALEALKSRRVFSALSNTKLKRLELLLKDLPATIVRQSSVRRAKLDHIFSGPARNEAARLHYRRSIEELRALVTGPEFDDIIHNPSIAFRAARLFEEHAQGMLDRLAGTIDSFSSLESETGLFNAIVRRLSPEDFPSLRLDAHHIIEGRTYEKFEDAWKLLGWDSANDMPCLPLLYEFHIRSPKKLRGIEKFGKETDSKSLTGQLLAAINLDKIRTPDELLMAYEKVYSRIGIWKDVRPVLTMVDRELTRRRTAARLVRELKKK